jgi:hypothetical protein
MSDVTWNRTVRRLVDSEGGNTRKEVSWYNLVYSEVVTRHLAGGTNTKNLRWAERDSVTFDVLP